eukprot:6199371-Pleurochrysis_carterae.AAC.1
MLWRRRSSHSAQSDLSTLTHAHTHQGLKVHTLRHTHAHACSPRKGTLRHVRARRHYTSKCTQSDGGVCVHTKEHAHAATAAR